MTDGQVVETAAGNPLDFIAEYQKRFKVALRPGLPRFCGGLAGYFGYDAVRYIEKKLESTCPPDTLGCPDILLLQCEELAVIDNLSGKLYLIVYADPATPEAFSNAKKRLRELKQLAPTEFDAWLGLEKTVAREDGVIPRKYRELIAIAVALTTQCPYCIDAYSKACLEKGSNVEEMTEAVHVAAHDVDHGGFWNRPGDAVGANPHGLGARGLGFGDLGGLGLTRGGRGGSGGWVESVRRRVMHGWLRHGRRIASGALGR